MAKHPVARASVVVEYRRPSEGLTFAGPFTFGIAFDPSVSDSISYGAISHSAQRLRNASKESSSLQSVCMRG